MLCPDKKTTTIASSIRVMECCALHEGWLLYKKHQQCLIHLCCTNCCVCFVKPPIEKDLSLWTTLRIQLICLWLLDKSVQQGVYSGCRWRNSLHYGGYLSICIEKQLRTADKGGPPACGLGMFQECPKRLPRCEHLQRPQTWTLPVAWQAVGKWHEIWHVEHEEPA